MRRSVSIALRIEVSGFLISWATSAANRSIASIRSHSARAEAASDRASSPTSSRRASSGGGHGAGPPLALAHLLGGAGEAQDRAGDGERKIPGQQRPSAPARGRTGRGWRAARRPGCRPPRAPRGSAARCRPRGGCARPARRRSPAAGRPGCGGYRAASRGSGPRWSAAAPRARRAASPGRRRRDRNRAPARSPSCGSQASTRS